jgi:hypothetical protein
MKTIIAGLRGVTDFSFVELAIKESGFAITEVVSGNARGVDKLGELWAVRNNISIKLFIPRWRAIDGSIDKRAGLVRNAEMAQYADALVAVWDGRSKGTKHMIYIAKARGMQVYVLNVTDQKRL